MTEPKKLAFLCKHGEQQFITPIIEHFKKDPNYHVHFLYVGKNVSGVAEMIRWADIVWQEWADEIGAMITNTPGILGDTKLLVRLHSSEAVNGSMEQVNWNSVDSVIFVANHVRRIAEEKMKRLGDRLPRIYMIPNAIDLNTWKLTTREPRKNLAWVPTVIRPLKGPQLMVQALQSLVTKDDEWTLHVAGKFSDQRDFMYVMHMIHELKLKNNIKFLGHVDDIQGFYQDMSAVVSFSSWEGNPVNIIEAAATGLRPIIHNFMGAKDQYPEEWVWNTVDEFTESVMYNYYHINDFGPREWADKYWNFNINILEIEKVLQELEFERETLC